MSAPAGRKDIFRKGLDPKLDSGYGIPLQNLKDLRIDIIRAGGHPDTGYPARIRIRLRKIEQSGHQRAVDPGEGTAEKSDFAVGSLSYGGKNALDRIISRFR